MKKSDGFYWECVVATASWMRFRFQLKMHINKNKYANDVHDAHRVREGDKAINALEN